MFSPSHELKVLDSVVVSYSVFVMDNFMGCQFSSQKSFYHMPMLENIAPGVSGNEEHNVAIGYLCPASLPPVLLGSGLGNGSIGAQIRAILLAPERDETELSAPFASGFVVDFPLKRWFPITNGFYGLVPNSLCCMSPFSGDFMESHTAILHEVS
jgi:hypothetical protein